MPHTYEKELVRGEVYTEHRDFLFVYIYCWVIAMISMNNENAIVCKIVVYLAKKQVIYKKKMGFCLIRNIEQITKFKHLSIEK